MPYTDSSVKLAPCDPGSAGAFAVIPGLA
jgi:hypothetical protein